MADLVAGSASSSSQPLQWLAVTLARSGFGQKQRRLGKKRDSGLLGCWSKERKELEEDDGQIWVREHRCVRAEEIEGEEDVAEGESFGLMEMKGSVWVCRFKGGKCRGQGAVNRWVLVWQLLYAGRRKKIKGIGDGGSV
uniref:Uncharacterized protein n=1 Tax=Populus alba TaxID=43335 RepID=A0A4U5PWK0_POPAL|nr:hypothetical protein D5086_0000168310 [Populus alba]